MDDPVYSSPRHWAAFVRSFGPTSLLLVTCAVAALAGATVDGVGWIWFAGLTTLGVIGVAWPLVAVATARVSLHVPGQSVHEGEPVRVQVNAPSRWRVTLIGMRVEIEGQQIEIDSELPTGPRSVNVRAAHRGRFPQTHGAATLSSSFPLGLFVARRTIAVGGGTIVRPLLLNDVGLPHSSTPPTGGPGRRLQHAANGGELVGVRPYRRGDSPRQIHWAATARADRLIAQQRADASHEWAVIILDDASLPSPARVGDDAAISNASREWAVRCAASMVARWSAAGIGVTVHHAGGSITVPPFGPVGPALDELALLSPSPRPTRVRTGSSASAASVLITGRADASQREAMTVLILNAPDLQPERDDHHDDGTNLRGRIRSVDGLRDALAAIGRRRVTAHG